MDERLPANAGSSGNANVGEEEFPANADGDGCSDRRSLLLWCTWSLGGLFLIIAAVLNLRGANATAKGNFKVFGTFWASGWASAHHLNPYTAYPLTFHPLANNPAIVDLNLSPPALLPFLSGWAAISPNIAVKIWAILSVMLFLASAALLVKEYGNRLQHRQLFWLLLGPSAFDAILMGQDYAIFLALAVGVWLLFRRNMEIGAGICLGLLVAAKPNYALWPIFLACCGHTRLAKVCALTVTILWCIPVLVYGPGIYMSWLHAISHDPHWMFPSDVSIFGFAARFGHPMAGRVISALVLVFSFAAVLWKRPSVEISSGVALSVAILCSPVAWVHYSLLLAPILLIRPWTNAFTWAIAPLLLPGFVFSRFMEGVAFLSSAIHFSGLAVVIANLFYFLPICFLLGYFLRETLMRTHSRVEFPMVTTAQCWRISSLLDRRNTGYHAGAFRHSHKPRLSAPGLQQRVCRRDGVGAVRSNAGVTAVVQQQVGAAPASLIAPDAIFEPAQQGFG